MKKTAILLGFVGAFGLSTLASAQDHGTEDPKVKACHEAHEAVMKTDKMDDAHMKHMKECHDKDGKLIGNEDGHMKKMEHRGSHK